MTKGTSNTSKMVQSSNKDLLIWGLLALLCIGGGWWWFQHMEMSWAPEMRTMDNYRKQPMLAASRLLKQRGYTVHEVDSLSVEAIDRAPNGTLIISNNDGTMSREQSQHLLAWVNKGNTLITFPQMRAEFPSPKKPVAEDEDKGDQDDKSKDKQTDEELRRLSPYLTPQVRRYNASMQDPIADYLGLASNYRQHVSPATSITKVQAPSSPASAASSPNQDNKTEASAENTNDDEIDDETYNDEDEHDYDEEIAQLIKDKGLTKYIDSSTVEVQLPHVRHSLHITRTSMAMSNFKAGPKAIYQDLDGSQLRLYRHGNGHIIVMPQNIFVGHNLKWNDNGQFLLDCAGVNSKDKHFTILKGLRLAPWYELLWQNFAYCIMAMAAFILLWSWRGSKRFGLVLPEMSVERRSLLEHIDASARWAWTTAKGRQQLVDAARLACQETLRRRAPELLRLGEAEMLQTIAGDTGIELTSLTLAWQSKAASAPLSFTKQIQLLQQLRAHYER